MAFYFVLRIAPRQNSADPKVKKLYLEGVALRMWSETDLNSTNSCWTTGHPTLLDLLRLIDLLVAGAP